MTARDEDRGPGPPVRADDGDPVTAADLEGLPEKIRRRGEDAASAAPRAREELEAVRPRARDAVWYERHLCWLRDVEAGREARAPERLAEDLAAGERVRARLRPEERGPWSARQVGELNGRLSAARWLLGGGWDDLDA